MKSLLIKDTTREEREKIVDEAVGNIDSMCDGCSPGILKMYQPYIDGEMELRDCNRLFRENYTKADPRPDRIGCGMGE